MVVVVDVDVDDVTVLVVVLVDVLVDVVEVEVVEVDVVVVDVDVVVDVIVLVVLAFRPRRPLVQRRIHIPESLHSSCIHNRQLLDMGRYGFKNPRFAVIFLAAMFES